MEKKQIFQFGNLSFKYGLEELRGILENLYGLDEVEEILEKMDDDEFYIHCSPGQAQEIIDELYPGKYVTFRKHVYYGKFQYKGNEESDIVEYIIEGNGFNDFMYFVGGEYNEDRSKPVDDKIFEKLYEDCIIEQEPKYEGYEFLISKNIKSLSDHLKKQDDKKSEKHGPHDLPDWVVNKYRISNEYNTDMEEDLEPFLSDNSIKLIGNEVYFYSQIKSYVNKISDWLNWKEYAVVCMSIDDNGFDKYDLPPYKSKCKYINEPAVISSFWNDEEKEIYTKLGLKFNADPYRLYFYNIRKDLKLPNKEELTMKNKDNIESINRCLDWFKQNNFPAFQRIICKLHSLKYCIWNHYKGIIKEVEEYKIIDNNGKIKGLCQLKDSFTLHGSYKLFYKNGNIKQIGSFKNGVHDDGKVKKFDE